MRGTPLPSPSAPPFALPWALPSGCLDRNHPVILHVAALRMLKTQQLHRQSHIHLRLRGVRNGRILVADLIEDLRAAHTLPALSLLRLTETGADHLRDVLLLHKLQVQFLNAGHLSIVKPIRRFQLTDLIHHLRIKLSIVDLTAVVDVETLWNPHTDETTTACDIRQRMGVVGGSHK